MTSSDLLLLHGTIYGNIPQPVPWLDFAGKTPGIDQWGTPVPWLTDIPYMAASSSPASGPLIDNSPIEFINWAAGPGVEAPSPLRPWQQCATLLTRF